MPTAIARRYERGWFVPAVAGLLFTMMPGASAQSGHAPPSPKEVRRKIAAARKLPDDPVQAVERLSVAPPATEQVAQFLGNQTAIMASLQNAFAMVRETDCSLTAFNAAYALSTTNTAAYNYQSRTLAFEQTLHATAGLTTAADQFANGCKDPGLGVLSNTLIYAGITPSQMRVGALAGYNGSVGQNVLYTIVSKEDGTLVGITAQPAPTGVAAGTAPVSVASADLNNDGVNDIITVNSAVIIGTTTVNPTITVYLGATDGSFTVGQSYAIPGTAEGFGSLVIDDFNGDGIPDVVVPSASGGFTSTPTTQITFLPGKGDGTFGAPKSLTVTGPPIGFGDLAEGLVSGDFNGDGKKDLICAMGFVFLGKGDGTFTQVAARAFPTIQTTSNTPAELAVGDFNKDGKLDVAAGSGQSIFIYLGNGDGTFTAGAQYASIENHGYLTAADLDGDGNLDLYSGDATNGIFGGDDFTPNMGYALMGNGDGTFRGAQQTQATAVQSLVDLNGDGKLDYAGIVLNPSTGTSTVTVYLGNGDGTFKTGAPVALSPFTYNGTTYTLMGIDSYAFADVNGDGHPDLVVFAGYIGANPGRAGFLVALGNSNGTFKTPVFTPFPSLIPGGGQDYLYTETGLFAAKRADGKTELVYSFLTQDFNGANLYYQGYATQVVNGDGTFGKPATTDTYTGATPPAALVLTPASNVVDLNGDNTPDLIQFMPKVFGPGGTLVTPAGFVVYPGKADGTFGAGQAVTVVDSPNGPITVADVNGDGKPDLLAPGSASSGSGEIGVALGNGDGSFQAPKTILLDTLGSDSPSMSVADFDGDGKADLVILGFQPPFDSGMFPGNGDGTFQSAPSGNRDGAVVPLQPIEIYATGSNVVADINGDGKPDIVGPTVLINQY